ncbi:MAG: 2-dehydro-3-deoxygalactonokinase [Rhizobiaceae bacterium]|nr:2-dehydro-3-deoxygalactonokinase [Rhizobiaceae bacterium]
MSAAPAIAAVDWGVTHLRVWLLDGAGNALAERRSGEGMLSAAGTGFSKVLERNLSELAAPADLPVIICGMAGGRQGWFEVSYMETPALLEAVLGGAVSVPGAGRDVRIVPGLAQRAADAPDVMRGEETGLAGLPELHGAGNHVACLPGTHSKWVALSNGAVTGFGTWMTGELYAVLTQQSVLKHSVGGGATAFPPASPSFAKGVEIGLADRADLTSHLFGIRAGGLLFGLSSEDAAAKLSGLLIGAEIGAAERRYPAAGPVMLVGSGLMYALYRSAFSIAGIEAHYADAESAVRAGLFEAARRCGMLD